MPGRRWSEGLHQAIEAKEGVAIQRETPDAGHDHLPELLPAVRQAGRHDRHGDDRGRGVPQDLQLDVVAIPTHRPMIRDDYPDLVFKNEREQVQRASIDEIEEMHEAGRPVLVGTVSIEKSEVLSHAAQAARHQARGAQRQVPRAEAGIVAQAGRSGAVTIATNMAGRGTDIMLGGNPAGLASEMLHKRGPQPGRGGQGDLRRRRSPRRSAITDEDHEKVVAAGGLHIIGTERHESRRIDNQLRGRAGRQGDPGSSRFYLSLDDDLMKRFASDRVAGLMERLGPRGRRRDRVAARVARPSRAPRPGSRASTSTSASASSSSTTSSTSSARPSTPSATRSCATRT